MYTFVVVLHVIVCVILVLSVLLQQGKGAEVGAVFGSSEAVFGSSGPASLLSKITTAVAVIFMVTSLSLTYLAAHHEGGSVMKDVAVPVSQAPVNAPASKADAGSGGLPSGGLSVNVEESGSGKPVKKADVAEPSAANEVKAESAEPRLPGKSEK